MAGGRGFAARKLSFCDHGVDLGHRIQHCLRQRGVEAGVRQGVLYELLTLGADGTYRLVKISGGCQVSSGKVSGLKVAIGFRIF